MDKDELKETITNYCYIGYAAIGTCSEISHRGNTHYKGM